MMEQDNPKIGFKWKWFAGIRVAKGYHYTNGVDVALAVADGVPATFEDERFLVKL